MSRALDELARKLWRALAEGFIADADAEALSESIEARRATLAGEVVLGTRISHKAARALPAQLACSHASNTGAALELPRLRARAVMISLSGLVFSRDRKGAGHMPS
jgi:hypothetical protein